MEPRVVIFIHVIVFFVAFVFTIITISEYGRRHEQFNIFGKLFFGALVFALFSFAELILVHLFIFKDNFIELIYQYINI